MMLYSQMTPVQPHPMPLMLTISQVTMADRKDASCVVTPYHQFISANKSHHKPLANKASDE